MPLMTGINERRPNPEREEKTLSEGVVADMGNLARILKEPAQYMTPGVGDYMAHQDAVKKYGKAKDAFKRGDYLQAVLYGGGGLGDDLTVVPGIGDVAMAGKGLGNLAVAGIMAGRGARGADLEMLKLAEEMDGVLPGDKIFDATGWFKGKDDKWRFEIDDSAAKTTRRPANFNDEVGGEELPVYTGKLPSVLSHDDLLSSYPELADIKTRLQTTGGRRRTPSGGYNEDFNLIEGRTGPIYDEGTKGLLLHELQHSVQKKEGFTRGGSPEEFMGISDDPVEQYRNLAGEYEARNVDSRSSLSADDRRMLNPLEVLPGEVPYDVQALKELLNIE